MKKLIFLSLMSIAMMANAQYSVTVRRTKVTPVTTTNMLLGLPKNYDSLRATPYPVVFVGKGLQEPFSSMQNNNLFGLLKSGFKPDTTDFVFIHLDHGSTSLIAWNYFAPGYIKNISKVNIDTNNICKVGYSAGGGYSLGGWFGANKIPLTKNDTVVKYARQVRAIVAMAPNHDVTENNFSVVDSVQIPTWIICGENDTKYIDRSRRFTSQINTRAPGYAELLIRPGVGHGGWNDVYSGKIKMQNGQTIWQFFTSSLSRQKPVPVTEIARWQMPLNMGTVICYSNGTYEIKKL